MNNLNRLKKDHNPLGFILKSKASILIVVSLFVLKMILDYLASGKLRTHFSSKIAQIQTFVNILKISFSWLVSSLF